MFKSIFTKYVAAFMTIIIVSFAILAAIVGTMITSYSVNEKRSVTSDSANTIKQYLENEIVKTQPNNLTQYIYYHYSSLSSTLTLFTSYTRNIIILICNLDGNVLIADRLSSTEYANSKIPQDLLDSAIKRGQTNGVSDFGGLLNNEQIYHAVALKDQMSSVCGVVFSISQESSLTEFARTMIRTVLTSMLWVMLAALVTVYFISEKITAPLKKISKAAKEFSKGNFKTRVHVHGNDEIAQLAESFNNMATELENHEKSRSAFVANISHDLRTPMTSISGFIDGMIEGAIPPEKYDYYLKIVATEVKRLSRLVSSLLQISRFEAGETKLNMTEFDICEMARQIVLSFEMKINEKKLNVEFECDEYSIMVEADKDSIYQILYNICDNGVKFSKEGGKYVISIRQKDRKVFVSVYNEGQGISEDDLPFIFDRFYKSDKSRGLDRTGVGLGLYISKTIIESHGQEIWARSVYGEYCEFVFTLKKA